MKKKEEPKSGGSSRSDKIVRTERRVVENRDPNKPFLKPYVVYTYYNASGEVVSKKEVPLEQERPHEAAGRVTLKPTGKGGAKSVQPTTDPTQVQTSQEGVITKGTAEVGRTGIVHKQEIVQSRMPETMEAPVGSRIATPTQPTQQIPGSVAPEYESAAAAFSEPSLLKRGVQQFREGETTEDKLKAVQTMYGGAVEATPFGKGSKERRLGWEEKVVSYEEETQQRIDRLKAQAETDMQRHASMMRATAEKDLMKQSVSHPDVSYEDKTLIYSTEEGLQHIERTREQAQKAYESQGSNLQSEWNAAMKQRSQMEQRRFTQGMPIIEKSPFAKAETKIASITTQKVLPKKAPMATILLAGHSISFAGARAGLKAREKLSKATGLKPDPELLKFEEKFLHPTLKFEKGLGEGAYSQVRDKPLSTATFLGVGFITGGLGVLAKGSKIATWSLKGVGAVAGTTYAGMKGVETYLAPGAEAKGKVVGGAGVEVGAVLAGATIGGKVAAKSKAKFQEFRFSRKVAKWEKGMAQKDWVFQKEQGHVLVEQKSGAIIKGRQTQIKPKSYDIYQRYQRPVLTKKGVSYHRQAKLSTKTTEKLKLESGKTLYREFDPTPSKK